MGFLQRIRAHGNICFSGSYFNCNCLVRSLFRLFSGSVGLFSVSYNVIMGKQIASFESGIVTFEQKRPDFDGFMPNPMFSFYCEMNLSVEDRDALHEAANRANRIKIIIETIEP